MADTVRYQVTRLGTRYGVHVDNLTRTEARSLMDNVAFLEEGRCGGMTPERRNDIIEAVEKPMNLDPHPAIERWINKVLIGTLAVVFFGLTFHDLIRELFK